MWVLMGGGMKCTSCGSDVPFGNKFCGQCGAGLSTACHACNHANLQAAKFCSECGANLTGVPNKSPSSAERRHLTVMFADMVGSSALSTQLDPEEQREIIASFQSCCSREI